MANKRTFRILLAINDDSFASPEHWTGCRTQSHLPHRQAPIERPGRLESRPMETRLYFVLGDLFANVLVASAAAGLCTWLIGGSWGMLPGMLTGMLLGMLVAMLISLPLLSPLLGVMEVMSPCMLSGMFGGMWGGMWQLGGAEVMSWGIGTGLVVIVAIYALNAVTTGPQELDS